MANIELKSIKFPDLDDTYIIKDYDDELSTKAEIDGYYTDMTVGDAEQLVSTVFTEDSVPYNFRTSGGAIDIGDREYDEIVGGTVAWNQLVQNGNFASATVWTGVPYTVSNNIATMTSAMDTLFMYQEVDAPANHKYLFSVDAMSDVNTYFYFAFGSTDLFGPFNLTNSWKSYATIGKKAGTSVNANIIRIHGGSGLSAGDKVYAKNANIIDLTKMFGSTIADYIYSLEQGSAGAGVAFFRKLFPKPYYSYDSGTLMSVKALSHDMVGFNAWDEEWEVGGLDANGAPVTSSAQIRSKNYIPVIGGQTYYIKSPYTGGIGIYQYDADKNYIERIFVANTTITLESNTAYLKFRTGDGVTTYNNDICINLSWDGERDGEYEPYVKRSYPLDSNLELRGIPKLSANNDLYYDGDVYEADGTVTRKYGVVDLGTLTWEKVTTNEVTVFASNVISDKAQNYNFICATYFNSGSPRDQLPDKSSGAYNNSTSSNRIVIRDDAITSTYTSAQFTTYISGVYLVYELATPTTETAEPYNEIQWVDDFGTEEYVDTRDVAVPVGHNTKYVPNLRAKLETAPDSPDTDGDYVMRHSNGVNSYVSLASNSTIQNIIARLEALEGGNE